MMALGSALAGYRVAVLRPESELKVALVKTCEGDVGSATYRGTRAVVELLLEHDEGFRRFADGLDGKVALVKPNLTKHPPKYSPHNKMTTDPMAVKAVVDWLLELGAELVYVGECNSWGTWKAYELCGYRELFSREDYRGKVALLDLRTKSESERFYVKYKLEMDPLGPEDASYLRGYVEARHATLVKFGRSKRVDVELALSTRYGFNRVLREVDLIVNVAKLKTQAQTVVSLSVKNLFGLLEPVRAKHAKHLGLDPLQEDISRRELLISYLNLSRSLAGLAAAVSSLGPPILHIVEGGIAMEGEGPLEHGSAREDRLVAGAWRCGATLDAVLSAGYMMISHGGRPYVPYHVSLASINGLGPADPSCASLILACDRGQPKSVRDLNSKPFAPPKALQLGCAPPYSTGESLLATLDRCVRELVAAGVDPDEPVTIVEDKTVPEVVLREF